MGDGLAGLITQAEYARRIGVSKVAVHKWVRAGIIPLRDGLIDPGEADRCRAAHCDPTRSKGLAVAMPQSEPPSSKKAEKPEVVPVAKKRKSPRAEKPAATQQPAAPASRPINSKSHEDTEDEQPEAVPTLNSARLEGEILKNKKRALELDEARGKLVDREKTKRAVFALARQEREHWQNWPARIAPVMAAELGIDTKRLQGVLDRRVREHLAEIADGQLRLRVV